MTSKRQRQKGWLLPEELTGYPLICVQFQIPDTREYRAATRGAIYELTKRWNWQWEGKGDYNPRDVAQIFRELIDDTLAFNEECSGAAEKSGCIDHPLDSPILEWNPNDPFRTPELVPAGYAFPPWYKANSITGITLGTSLGDIVTDIVRTQSIPVIPPASGYPRLRIHLKGSGTVELHLVKINTGGYVQITTDDDFFSAEFCSLNKDVIAIPPESTDDIIIERTVQGEGEHHIDLLFVPRVNDELLPPVTQGGAIRKIVLCGFDEMDECPDCPDCEDCPEPCGDDCDELEDFLEDFCFDDLPELEDYMYYAAPFVGQLVAGVVPPTSGGWLLCNGSPVNKADYPELYAVLLGKVGEDTLTFNLPDFSDRIPMGAGSVVDVLATGGEAAHTLTVEELPAHVHDVGAHTHTTEDHTHTQQAHNHTQDAHTHIQQSHTHNQDAHNHTQAVHSHGVVDPGHSHDVPVRNSLSAFGTGVIAAGANVTPNSARTSDTALTNITLGGVAAVNNPATASNQHAVAVNNAATATNQAATAVNNPANVVVNPSDQYQTGSNGQGESFPIIPPVIGVNWFIFAGGKECC